MGNEQTGDGRHDERAPGDLEREPGSVLVVRAWRTGSGSGAFRARVIRVGDLPHGAARSIVTSNPDELCDVVRAWVAEVGE